MNTVGDGKCRNSQILNETLNLLRSAVGKTHVLRSGLVMDYTTYSEIDHLHLSIEAQCVSHLLPLGDCHETHARKYTTEGFLC